MDLKRPFYEIFKKNTNFDVKQRGKCIKIRDNREL